MLYASWSLTMFHPEHHQGDTWLIKHQPYPTNLCLVEVILELRE